MSYSISKGIKDIKSAPSYYKKNPAEAALGLATPVLSASAYGINALLPSGKSSTADSFSANPALMGAFNGVVNFDPEKTRSRLAKQLAAAGLNSAAAYSGAARATNKQELQNLETQNAIVAALSGLKNGLTGQIGQIKTTDDLTAFLASMGG